MSGSAEHGQPHTVLLVEDDEATLRLFVKALEREGHTVIEARTGEAGLLAIVRSKPELAVVDYRLPDMEGEEFLRRLGPTAGTEGAPRSDRPAVIVVSGHGSEEIVAKVLDLGAMDYVMKEPGIAGRLASVVARALARLDRERALRESEERFRALYEDAPLPYQSLSPEGTILAVNRAWLALTGLTSEDEAIGRRITDFLTPASAALFLEHFAGLVERGAVDGVEFDFLRRDSAVVPVAVHGRIARDAAGGFERTHCIVRDLTAQRRAEKMARESAAEYGRVVEMAQEGIWVRNADDRTVFVNRAAADLLGYTVAEMLGQPVECFLPEDGVPAHREQIARRARGISERFEMRLICKDRSIRTVDMSATPLVNDEGVYAGSLGMLTDITEIKEQGNKLRASSEKLASVLRATPVGIGLVSNRQIIEVNDAFCHMVGYERAELLGQNARLIYPSQEEYDRVGRVKYAQIAQTGSGAVETQWLRKDGRLIDVLLSSTYLDAEDTGKGVTFTAQDITELKRTERALRASVESWRSTFDAVPDPLCILDDEQRIVTANRPMLERLGLTAEEAVGRHCYALVHGADEPPDWCPYLLLNHTVATKTVEMSEPRLGGQFSVTVAPIVGPDGRPIGTVHVARDITELQRSRAQMASLYELATRAFETEEDLLSFALDEAQRLTGSSFAYAHFVTSGEVDLELIAWSASTRSACSAPTDRKYSLTEAGIWADCVRTGKPTIHNDYQTEPGRKGYPPGHVPIVRHMSVPVLEDGRPVMVTGVANKTEVYDEDDARSFQLYMTEVWQLLRRHRAESAYRALYQDLEQRVDDRTAQLRLANAELDAFAYSVSHDLMAPLRRLGQFAEDLAHYGKALDDDGRRDVERIRGQADGLRAMVDALLRLSRETQGEIRRERLDLSDVSRRILGDLREESPERSVEVIVEDGLGAHCDAAMVTRVLDNLLRNAWKFSASAPVARIEVRCVERNGRRWFCVRDNGTGFPAAGARRLFAPFQRYHGEREYPGLGIGLATAQRIIHRHGGRIEVESEVDRGAAFYFTLDG